MMERIKNALAEGPRAAASTIHYLYLARIPFLGWLTLFVLPLFARWVGRPLVLGAYDLASGGEAFFVGIAYGLAGGSIYFTAHVITNLCSKRFRLVIDPIVQSRIDKVWAGAIIVAFFVNILVAAAASKPIHSYSGQIAGAMVLGMLIAFAGALVAREISFRLAKNPTYRGLVWLGIKIGLRKQKGYLRPVSADIETDNPAKWEYEDGQIRAVCYTFIVIVAYCVITGKQVAPLVALMLLVSLWVLDQLGRRLKADSGGAYDLPRSIRLISGVSGGSVGGMFYAENFNEAQPDFSHSFQAACSSALGPTTRGLLRQDLWRALMPFLVTDICNDRGRVLERQWCKSFDNKFKPTAKLSEATLSTWGADALLLKRPALIFNSTIVETGSDWPSPLCR